MKRIGYIDSRRLSAPLIPGDGIGILNLGASGSPIVYAATGDIAASIYMQFTLATDGSAKGLHIETEYAPTGNTGTAGLGAIEGRLVCSDAVTNANWLGQRLYALRGFLNFTGTSTGAGVALSAVEAILGAGTYTTFQWLAGLAVISLLTAEPGAGLYCGVLVTNTGGWRYDFGFYAQEGCVIAYSYDPIKADHETLAVYHVDATDSLAIQNFLYTEDSASIGAFLYIDAAGGYYADDAAHPHAVAAGEIAVNFAGAGRYIRTWKE